MGLDRELGFMKELTRLRLRISALEAALKAERAEVDAWRGLATQISLRSTDAKGPIQDAVRGAHVASALSNVEATRAATDASRRAEKSPNAAESAKESP